MLPCAVGLLFPGLIVVLLGGRRRLEGLLAFTLLAAIVAWMRAADLLGQPGRWVLVALALTGGTLLTQSARGWPLAGGGGGLIGAVAGATWTPCVGAQLASILNQAPVAPLAELLPMLAYVAGVTSILFVVALLPVVVEWFGTLLDRDAVALLGGALAISFMLALAGGVYGDLLSEFARLSVR